MRKTKLFLTLLFTLFAASLPITAHAWDGKADGTGTHAIITEQAVKILNNDLDSSEPQIVKHNVQILNQYIHKLKFGSTYPDYDPNGWKLYQDHFWDPDTGYNFTHTATWYTSWTVPDTADSQARKYATLAASDWKKGNYENASFLLGQALHYIGDINVPYHAANVTNVEDPAHAKYEKFATDRSDKYFASTLGGTTKSSVYSKILTTDCFSTWITKNNTNWGKMSKDLYYSKSTSSNSWEDWEYSVSQAIPNSEKHSAELLYRFINEVSGTMPASQPNFNQFQVVIKTADIQHAGTDDYIYFGFQTNDGKQYEFTLDNPGNDFERNQTDTYTITLPTTIDATTITNTWIRKANYLAGSDDWQPENIKLLINGSVKQDVNINSWLKGNVTYTMPVEIN
ncbi:phospholipase C/alpha-toxin [Oikeobacillus pervagus]|uniref:Phospholipase C n=1 Tax=Oikeobacillus pervagus TaxID=1325931 RepID=A0AAJ1T2M9_9BACI|nr:phospholipase C [Oikeobacillus pervagus]MDQ0216057.1 phospholipase C/alpha-toxin [Oikeobacillus pervagus]